MTENSDYSVLYVGLCNFLLQHYQQDQIVGKFAFFI
jgi:hypothetical protein